jgi:hypothetical protein
MEIVAGLLAAAGLTILLLLSIPIEMAVNLQTPAAAKIRVRLIWLFGLVEIRLSRPKPKPGKDARKQTKKLREGASVDPRIFLALRTQGLPAAAGRLMRRLLAAISMRDCALNVRFGLDDPADTGIVLGAAAPAMSLLGAWSGNRFSAEADFNEEILEVNGQMTIRIYPIRIVGASAMFLLSPPVLRASKAIIFNR